MPRLLFFLCLLVPLLSQKELKLNQAVKISLLPNDTQSYSVTISQQNISNNQTDLFIFAQPVILAPSQIPQLTVSLQKDKNVVCFTDADELEGMCRIPNNQLSEKITFTLKCQQNCDFWLSVYLNSVVSLSLDKQYNINHKTTTQAVYQFDFKIPHKQFDQLSIVLQFLSGQGAEMFANVGNSGALQPNQKSHQYKAVPIPRGISLDLPQDEVPAGTWVKLSIFTSQIVKMELSAVVRLGRNFQLSLQQTKYGQIPRSQNATYNITMEEYYSQIQIYDLTISVTLFSGYPQISVSFNPQFKNALKNSGVGGNLVYLLTPQLRNKNNYTGKIFICIQSFNEQSSYKIYSELSLSNLIYMRQGMNYLSAVQSGNVKNYIYDYFYEAPKNISSNHLLYFAVRIHMLHGSILYYSRICNKSFQDCIVAPKDLKNKQFQKQVIALPGQILKYFANYEIYQWARLNQCKKIPVNATADKYHCKVHIVGYNYRKKECEWIMAMYSRQNNIQLSQGRPFKDKVFEQAYNYYQFTPPQGSYQDVTIFLTLLTGQASLVASTKNKRPEFMFYKNDNTLKKGKRSQITYKQSQIKNKIYIGVYGNSMAEYMIHVVMTRQHQQSIISLPPQLGQLFRFGSNTQTMRFILTPPTPGPWKVQVNPINSKLNVELKQKNTDKIVCNSTRCQFTEVKQQQYVVEVSPISINSNSTHKEIRFIITYYPASECRILPINVPNFVNIPQNTQECLEYILDGRSVMIAYSRNLLDSFAKPLNISLKINDKEIGLLTQHYKTLSKQTIENICEKGQKCTLKILAQGSSQGDVDLWMTTALTQTGIPLFPGVVLPLNRQNIQANTSLKFYYEVLQESSLTLVATSITYNNFKITWKWIDQQTYLKTKNDDQLYPSITSPNSAHITQFHRTVDIRMTPDSSCFNCILLISVFPIQDMKQCSLQLQIIGQAVSLGVGQTVKQRLGKDQSLVVMIPASQYETVVSLAHYNSAACYQASTLHIPEKGSKQINRNQIKEQEIILLANQSKQIELIGLKEQLCLVKVARWQTSTPIRQLTTSNIYEVSLKDNQKAYFLYYNQMNTSFRIYEVISSGSVYSYATPLINSTLQQTLKQDAFLFGSASPYQDLYVDSSTQAFCQNCYYLIKLVGAPSVSLQLGISDSLTPVLLGSGGLVRQKLRQKSTRVYEFYAVTSFKLRFTIQMGSLMVTTKNYLNNQLQNFTIKSDKQIQIKNEENMFNIYYITIFNNQTTIYTLQVLNQNGTRLIQGYTFTHYFGAGIAQNFIYQHSRMGMVRFIVIVQYQMMDFPDISVSVMKITTLGNGTLQKQKVQVVRGSRSGNIFVFSFYGQVAEYVFGFISTQNITAKVLITRNKLTYLPPKTPLLSQGQSILQIDTKGSKVMVEVFPCNGNIEVHASQDYADIQKTNKSNPSTWSQPVVLEHNNIAGHYVVSSHAYTPEYYTKISGSLYRVSYNYLSQQIPYKDFSSVRPTIQYLMSQQGIKLMFEVPLPQKISFSQMLAYYTIIFDGKLSKVKEYAQCLNENLFTITKELRDNNYPFGSQAYSVFLQKQQMKEIFQQKINPLFIGIRLTNSYQHDHQPITLTYIYQPVEINVKELEVEQDSTWSLLGNLFLWVLLLVFIGVLVLASIKFCWKNWRVFRNTRQYVLQEEQDSQTSSFQAMQKQSEQASIQN